MPPTPIRTSPLAAIDDLAAALADPSRRIAVLAVAGYATAAAGLALSFIGDPTDPDALYGVAGIALMACSFLCLFVASVTVLDFAEPGR